MPIMSLFWAVLFAGIGGVFVVMGLVMEQVADKELFKNVAQYRCFKKIKLSGEWAVIFGVLCEVYSPVPSRDYILHKPNF